MSFSSVLLMALATPAPVAAPPALAIRTCPEGQLYSYPLETQRDAKALMVAGIAIANPGPGPVSLETVSLELVKNGAPADVRTLGKSDLEAAASGTKAIVESGMLDLVGFQFCDGRLLGGAKPAKGAVLQPGEVVMISNQTFAWRGKRDSLRIVAEGTELTVPIDGKPTKPIRWPLAAGAWMIAAGPSFHTAHRWALPEQFALDILKVDAAGKTHRDAGKTMRDFYAYGAPVVAVADGTVAAVFRAARDEAPLLRAPGESDEAYLGRVQAGQVAKLAGGSAGVLGESIALRIADRTYAIYAHLAPGSVKLAEGDVVKAGAVIGQLGNTGNTTEPHLHFQLCDAPGGLSCAGIPMTFDDIELPLSDNARPLQSGDIVIKR